MKKPYEHSDLNVNLKNRKISLLKYESFDEDKLFSPKLGPQLNSIINDFKRKVNVYKIYYSELILLRTRSLLDYHSDYTVYRKEMIDILKSILRIEDISFIYINNEEDIYEWKTTTFLKQPFKALIDADLDMVKDQ